MGPTWVASSRESRGHGVKVRVLSQSHWHSSHPRPGWVPHANFRTSVRQLRYPYLTVKRLAGREAHWRTCKIPRSAARDSKWLGLPLILPGV